jgi:hypothetical protein
MTTITEDMIEHTDLHTSKSAIDALIVNYDSKRYLVEIVPDEIASIDDADCYSTDDEEAFLNDVWMFAGVIVTPLDVPVSRQFELSDSLWGLEYNFLLDPPQEIQGRIFTRTNTNYLVMHYPVPDMLSEVIRDVKRYDTETAIKAFIYG